MARIELSNQSSAATAIKNRTDQLRTQLENRKEIWSRLPIEKKHAWIKSGKDPIMTLAWQTYRYLRDNFFGSEVDNG